jgi:putative holliday junction resolvase
MVAAINVLGLDVGEKRIGVARVNTVVGLPEPLGILSNDNTVIQRLQELVAEYDISHIVVGVPRNLEGQETAQSAAIRTYSESLHVLGLPIVFQDETLSSHEAAERVGGHSVKKGTLDALAACVILEDYIQGLS